MKEEKIDKKTLEMNEKFYNKEVYRAKKQKKIIRKIKIVRNIVSILFSISVIIIAFTIYSRYDYNYYIKGILEYGNTEFTRDSNIKYDKGRSYKIENKEFSDAIFYRIIKVKPNTAYRIKVKVKTENVESENGNEMAGAQIAIGDYEEHSKVLNGTSDWQELSLSFNSKTNEELRVGFRLGGNNLKAKGIAWFDDIVLEEGNTINNNNWKFLVCLLDNVDLEINGEKITTRLLEQDVKNIEDSLERFKESSYNFSSGNLIVDYDVFHIEDPITTCTYEEENGYYFTEKDVNEQINKYFEKGDYDHIFVCFRLDDKYVKEWIGLGNMVYQDKGFSNIRIIDYKYKYTAYNTFPEETFLHEFLHTLERNSLEYGYQRPELHDHEKYGYYNEANNGLLKWYADYMNKKIETEEGYIGLPQEIFYLKPPQDIDFKNKKISEELKEPDNIIEIVDSIIYQFKNIFNKEEINLYTEGAAN